MVVVIDRWSLFGGGRKLRFDSNCNDVLQLLMPYCFKNLKWLSAKINFFLCKIRLCQ